MFVVTVKARPTKAQLERERITARFARELDRVYAETVARVRGAITDKMVADALRIGNADAILRAIPENAWAGKASKIEKARRMTAAQFAASAPGRPYEGRIGSVLFEVARDSARRSAKRMGFNLRFDLDNPHVLPWLQKRTADLVTAVDRDTREAIRQVVSRAFTTPLDERRTAKDVAVELRSVVGLRPDQIAAVENRRAALAEEGFTGRELSRRVNAYAEQKLRERTKLIARTEVIAAENSGLQASWNIAVDDGLLIPSETRRVWIATPEERTCETCNELDGQERGLDEPWDAGEFGAVDFPPAHPACRCTMGLVFD